MGRRQQRAITDLTSDSTLRNMIEQESESTKDMATGMRWQKHNKASRKFYSKKRSRALTVLC